MISSHAQTNPSEANHDMPNRDEPSARLDQAIRDTAQGAEVIRLPLWRHCLDELRKAGIAYGKTFPAEFFETHLKSKRNEMQFGLDVSNIRRELEKDGYYLSGRGQNGTQFVILQAAKNGDQMQHYGRAAADALKRGVILGTNTRLDALSPQDRKRHEGILERLAIQSVLLNRSTSIRKHLEKTKPKLIS